SQVVGGNVELLRYGFYRGNAFFQTLLLAEVSYQNLFKALQQFMIRFFSGEELPLIKPFRINQQQDKLSDNKVLTELVHIALIFLFNVLKNVDHLFFFFVRKEKRLIYGILKEVIGLDFLRQWRVP